jgi:DNA invertase Pin-like site-specific DNA recombinase
MRIIVYSRQASSQCGAQVEVLRKSIEDRCGTIVGIVADDATLLGRGKYAGWNAMMTNLEDIDQIVVGCAGDLPGKKVNDLLAVLTTLRDYHVSLFLYRERINSDDGAAAILDLIASYRRVKLSDAIRYGQAKALAQGRKPGRPGVPSRVREQIQTALSRGAGIRPTARRFAVSAASVINIRDAMMGVERERMAA